MRRFLITLCCMFATVIPWELFLRPQFTRSVSAQPAATADKNNEGLARLYEEDQSDRMPKDGKAIDWAVVAPRDKKRLNRVREVYEESKLITGADYYHVAMVLQHSNKASDHLLAHELCVVAIGKGEERAKWLAAASEDRFLMNIDRPQRFATQYRSTGLDGPMLLYKVEDGVTDELRRAFKCPTLKEAKDREAQFNEKPKADK
jgi:hypothetical protein